MIRKNLHGICCFYVGLAPLLGFGLTYVKGLSGRYTTFLLLPPFFFVLLAAVICLLIIVSLNLKDALKRELQWRKLLLAGLCLAAFILSLVWLPAPPAVFLQGFLVRIARTVTYPGVEKIAAAAQKHLPDDAMVWVVEKRSRNPEEARRLEALAKAVDLSRLPPNFTISNRRSVITLSWGSALTGHWGFRFSENDLHRDSRDYDFVPVRDHLVAFYSD